MKPFSYYLDKGVERMFTIFLPVGVVVFYAVEELKEFIAASDIAAGGAVVQLLTGQCGILG